MKDGHRLVPFSEGYDTSKYHRYLLEKNSNSQTDFFRQKRTRTALPLRFTTHQLGSCSCNTNQPMQRPTGLACWHTQGVVRPTTSHPTAALGVRTLTLQTAWHLHCQSRKSVETIFISSIYKKYIFKLYINIYEGTIAMIFIYLSLSFLISNQRNYDTFYFLASSN